MRNKLILGLLISFLVQVKSYSFVDIIDTVMGPISVSKTDYISTSNLGLDAIITSDVSGFSFATDEDIASNDITTLPVTYNVTYSFVLTKDVQTDTTQKFVTIVWGGRADTKALFTSSTSSNPGIVVQDLGNPQQPRMAEFSIKFPAGAKAGDTVSVTTRNSVQKSVLANAQGNHKPSFSGPYSLDGPEVQMNTLFVPTIDVYINDISFGQLDTGNANASAVEFGNIKINPNSKGIPNNMKFNFPSQVNLQNIVDPSSIAKVRLKLVDANNQEIVNNTLITNGTKYEYVYLSAELRATEIYNKKPGSYNGSVNVQISVN